MYVCMYVWLYYISYYSLYEIAEKALYFKLNALQVVKQT